MDDNFKDLKRDELDNYISVLLGFRFTVEGLQDYAISNLKQIHVDIKKKCQLPACSNNCSRRFGHSFGNWCLTCKLWKTELCSRNKFKNHWDKINWKAIDTIDFQHSYEEMAKVFIKDFHTAQRGVLQDLSALLSLFKNSTKFNIGVQTIDEIRRNRNLHCAHNYKVSLIDLDKRTCLESALKLLKVPEILRTQTAKDALNKIQTLYSSEGIPGRILQNPTGRQALTIVQNEAVMTSPDSDETDAPLAKALIEKRFEEITIFLEREIHHQLYKGPKPKSFQHFGFLTVSVMVLIYGLLKSSKVRNSKGCLSMRFDEYWNQNVYLNFDHHVEMLNNESFIERKWLGDLVSDQLKTSERGLILVADMGYGKSSIISKIVCADEHSVWYKVREPVLAYHFCRYDSVPSTNAAYFIRLLAGTFVKNYPELGNAILSDTMASEILYGLQCDQDPVLCLEIAVLTPLRKHWNNYQFIIIIDALDECDTRDSNSILNLLNKQLQKFPTNVKFIFTSRNIESILNKFKQMKIIHLTSNSYFDDNINDISMYIRHVGQLSLTQNEISLLTKVASGNFLHVNLYLQYCVKTGVCDFKNIPDSLDMFYQLNFERIFENETSMFEDCRPILEILCAMTKVVNEEKLIRIANITSNVKRRHIERLLGNELGHFVRVSDKVVSFVHKSIPDFLTNTSRKHLQFFIRKENGHKLLAADLLKSFNISEQFNLIETVHHVAASGDLEYQSLLQEYINGNEINNDGSLYLHKTVRQFNSYRTTCLMLKLIKLKHIDATDDKNMSAAFIATVYGHYESLQCLLNEGANVNFKVIFSNWDLYAGQDLVRVCKQVYFCGYNMLHVASQKGYLNMVKTIIKFSKSLVYAKTDMSLDPFQLAAENGHIDVTQFLLAKNKNIVNSLSLHHASQNGHFKIVEQLLRYGINDECLPCNGSIYWIPLISYRQQQDVKILKRRNELTYKITEVENHFHDDWHLITCDTALNAAVRNGHLKIVKILSQQNRNALNCTAFDGKTPIMTAIQYNRTDIFRYLLDLKWNWQATCKQSPNFRFDLKLSKSEISVLHRNQCPHGASIMHLLAIYYSFEMFLALYNKGFKNVEERDNQLLTPLHYAFCHNSYAFIAIARELGANFFARSGNGSMPFHSSAICGSSAALFYLRTTDNDLRLDIPDVHDFEGRSILQYALLYSNNTEIDTNIYFQFRVAIDSKHDLYHTDKHGRNFLHYAALSGNHFAFQYANTEPVMNFSELIGQKNIYGWTPFEELFHSMSKQDTNEVIKIPARCKIEDIFYRSCDANLTYVLSSHELCILEMAIHLKNNNGFEGVSVSNLIRLSVQKSRVYPILILKVYAADEFKASILNSQDLYNSIADFQGPHLAELIITESSALNCKGGTSPLHRIVLNYRNMNWEYASFAFLDKFVKNINADVLDACFDSDGYNLLHRSVIGGNIHATKYLVMKGMNIDQLTIKKEGILDLSILKAPYFLDGHLPHYYSNRSRSYLLSFLVNNKSSLILQTDDGVVDFDKTSTYILDAMYSSSKEVRMKLKHMLCPKGQQLGLIHIAAAKGLILFLQKTQSLYGNDILRCTTTSKLSPYYLALIYNQNNIKRWLDQFVTKIKPDPAMESLLLYNIIFNYKRSRKFDWTCVLQYRDRFSQLLRNIIRRCIRRENEFKILTVNPQRSKIVSHIYATFSSMIVLEKKEFDSHDSVIVMFCSEFFTDFHDVCGNLIQMKNLRKGVFHTFNNLARMQFKKLIMFGLSDAMYVFQNLFKHQDIRQNYSKLLLFHSIFSLQHTYLNILSSEEDLHRDWLYHTAENILTVQQPFNYFAYSQYERDLVLMKQNNLKKHYLNKMDEIERYVEMTYYLNRLSGIINMMNSFGEDIAQDLFKFDYSSHDSEMLQFEASTLQYATIPESIKRYPGMLKQLLEAKPKCKRILEYLKSNPEKKVSASTLKWIRHYSELIVNFKL